MVARLGDAADRARSLHGRGSLRHPSTRGTSSFTVGVTDGSQSATQALSLAVAASNTSIWAATAVPTNVDHGADSPVELGMKFRSDVSGTVKGVRFYKATSNTGSHVGNLWTSTGTLLASVTFVGETASGWQQVNFATPVSITANTIYVVSYHTDVGHYSQDLGYFASIGVDSPPLHALASTVSPNGVYAYGAAGSFPAGAISRGTTGSTWFSLAPDVGPIRAPAPGGGFRRVYPFGPTRVVWRWPDDATALVKVRWRLRSFPWGES
jgi:Domain of unknown function (DUF4082)